MMQRVLVNRSCFGAGGVKAPRGSRDTFGFPLPFARLCRTCFVRGAGDALRRAETAAGLAGTGGGTVLMGVGLPGDAAPGTPGAACKA